MAGSFWPLCSVLPESFPQRLRGTLVGGSGGTLGLEAPSAEHRQMFWEVLPERGAWIG